MFKDSQTILRKIKIYHLIFYQQLFRLNSCDGHKSSCFINKATFLSVHITFVASCAGLRARPWWRTSPSTSPPRQSPATRATSPERKSWIEASHEENCQLHAVTSMHICTILIVRSYPCTLLNRKYLLHLDFCNMTRYIFDLVPHSLPSHFLTHSLPRTVPSHLQHDRVDVF